MNCVIFSGVTAEAISPSVFDGDVEGVARGVFCGEQLNWVMEVSGVAVGLHKIGGIYGALVNREFYRWSLSIFPAGRWNHVVEVRVNMEV